MSSSGLLQFAGQKYLCLETFRKNGLGVRTPVWFAASGPISPDSSEVILYVYTIGNSGKGKPIRNNPRVRIAPSNKRGGLRGGLGDADPEILDGEEGAQGKRLAD